MSGRKSTVDSLENDDLLMFDRSTIADQEARNGLLQFDEVVRLIVRFAPQRSFSLTPELIQSLNRIAITGIRRSAGQFRRVPIGISNTAHRPPAHEEVPRFVDEMCAYVNANWNQRSDDVSSAIHIGAYLMWRLNWIHPFRDGNGRTSRAVSYLALSVRLGMELVGIPTIPDQIVDDKLPYYAALDAGDHAWSKGLLDVSIMESLIHDLLIKQLTSA